MNKDIISQIVEQINTTLPECKNQIMLNEKQVSTILNCSPSTLFNYRKKGIGPEWKKPSRRVMYPKIKVAEFIADTITTA
jgi:hypothetical protein